MTINSKRSFPIEETTEDLTPFQIYLTKRRKEGNSDEMASIRPCLEEDSAEKMDEIGSLQAKIKGLSTDCSLKGSQMTGGIAEYESLIQGLKEQIDVMRKENEESTGTTIRQKKKIDQLVATMAKEKEEREKIQERCRQMELDRDREKTEMEQENEAREAEMEKMKEEVARRKEEEKQVKKEMVNLMRQLEEKKAVGEGEMKRMQESLTSVINELEMRKDQILVLKDVLLEREMGEREHDQSTGLVEARKTKEQNMAMEMMERVNMENWTNWEVQMAEIAQKRDRLLAEIEALNRRQEDGQNQFQESNMKLEKFIETLERIRQQYEERAHVIEEVENEMAEVIVKMKLTENSVVEQSSQKRSGEDMNLKSKKTANEPDSLWKITASKEDDDIQQKLVRMLTGLKRILRYTPYRECRFFGEAVHCYVLCNVEQMMNAIESGDILMMLSTIVYVGTTERPECRLKEHLYNKFKGQSLALLVVSTHPILNHLSRLVSTGMAVADEYALFSFLKPLNALHPENRPGSLESSINSYAKSQADDRDEEILHLLATALVNQDFITPEQQSFKDATRRYTQIQEQIRKEKEKRRQLKEFRLAIYDGNQEAVARIIGETHIGNKRGHFDDFIWDNHFGDTNWLHLLLIIHKTCDKDHNIDAIIHHICRVPNSSLVNERRASDLYTPLHLAVHRGQLCTLKVLLHYHPDLNLKNKRGETALHLAYEKNDPIITKCLLEAGSSFHTLEAEEIIKKPAQRKDKSWAVIQSYKAELAET